MSEDVAARLARKAVAKQAVDVDEEYKMLDMLGLM